MLKGFLILFNSVFVLANASNKYLSLKRNPPGNLEELLFGGFAFD
jgi:hypothetical protein